jgi:hypothetical protein
MLMAAEPGRQTQQGNERKALLVDALSRIAEAADIVGWLPRGSGTRNRRIREYIDEQKGEQIADDSRFPIDNS